MTICPCCGFKSANSASGVVLHHGCQACGARAVGEALPRPAHELPSYGRSLVVVVMGALMVLIFLSQTIIALVQRSTLGATSKLALASIFPTDLGAWLAAAETAAWRLKWVMIPLTVLVIFASSKLYRSIQSAPARFCGQRYARNAYLASAAVSLLVLILIGVTVPVRLRHRQWGNEAETKAVGYAFARVMLEYRDKFGTLPSDTKDLARLPDRDGSIAALLKEISLSEYKVSAEVAAVPKQDFRPLRGAVIRNASLNTAAEEPLTEGLSFTNYELRLPGADKLLNTEDDLIVIDGVTYRVSEVPRHGVGANSAARKLQR